MGLIKGYKENNFCESSLMPVIKKSLYKTQILENLRLKLMAPVMHLENGVINGVKMSLNQVKTKMTLPIYFGSKNNAASML